jgi:hypothetical protein
MPMRTGAEIERSKHPVSFWVTTILVFLLGLLFLVAGLRDLFSHGTAVQASGISTP